MERVGVIVRPETLVSGYSQNYDGNYIGRDTGDLNGAGEVGESEYGEKADMRERSGDGSRGDFSAIIIAGNLRRS